MEPGFGLHQIRISSLSGWKDSGVYADSRRKRWFFLWQALIYDSTAAYYLMRRFQLTSSVLCPCCFPRWGHWRRKSFLDNSYWSWSMDTRSWWTGEEVREIQENQQFIQGKASFWLVGSNSRQSLECVYVLLTSRRTNKLFQEGYVMSNLFTRRDYATLYQLHGQLQGHPGPHLL